MFRPDEARILSLQILEGLESSQKNIEMILMKTKRLARLMRDTDAQNWLDLEMRGYPNEFNFKTLGSCEKYSIANGRITSEGSYCLISLPALETQTVADEASIESIRSSQSPSLRAKDFTEKSATEALIASQRRSEVNKKQAFINNKGLFAAIKSGVHSYVTDIYLAIELGDVAQNIFEQARADIDKFVSVHCPKAAEKLLAINERLSEDSSESRSAALLSCRRLLLTVADSLFPPQEKPWKDQKGKDRTVGPEEYKNRLLAYLSDRIVSETDLTLITSEIEHLSARLDAINNKVCKGVHVEVSKEEANLAVIHTYLFIGEIARICKLTV